MIENNKQLSKEKGNTGKLLLFFLLAAWLFLLIYLGSHGRPS